jgi:hypothetical protein
VAAKASDTFEMTRKSQGNLCLAKIENALFTEQNCGRTG